MGSSINKNINIVCSDLAFRFLRKDFNNYVFLKFSNELANIENTVIIGVSGFSTFHYIDNESDQIQSFLSSLDNELALEMDEIINLSNRIPFTRSTEILNTLDESFLVDESVGFQDDNTNGTDMNFDNSTDSNVQNLNQNDHFNTLNDVVKEFEHLDIKTKFSSTKKIDFHLSSHILFEDYSIKCTQTFDVDGIFIFVDQLCVSQLIKCPLTIIKEPMIAWKRDRNTFKNTFKNLFDNFESFQMIKFGFLTFETGNCDLFVCYGLNSSTVNEDLTIKMSIMNHQKYLKDALDFAKGFPCNSCPEHRVNCPSQDYIAQRESSLPFSGLREDNISSELVPCFFYHLNIALHRLLNIQGLKFSFYLRMIGSKSLLISTTLENLSYKIENLASSLDFLSLPEENVYIDFCIQSVPFETEGAIQVLIIL